MNTTDIRFTTSTVNLLQSLVGKHMESFSCEHLAYSTSVYGKVDFQIEGDSYQLSNFHEPLNFFGSDEDVGVFKFRQLVHPTDADSLLTNTLEVTTPIHQPIKEIHLVNEHQQLFLKGEINHELQTVRGIIFILEDGREISFEKEIWFSEMIDVKTGHNLVETFEGMDDFLDNWSEYPEYEAKAYRYTEILH